jgi:hypothetical protein
MSTSSWWPAEPETKSAASPGTCRMELATISSSPPGGSCGHLRGTTTTGCHWTSIPSRLGPRGPSTIVTPWCSGTQPSNGSTGHPPTRFSGSSGGTLRSRSDKRRRSSISAGPIRRSLRAYATNCSAARSRPAIVSNSTSRPGRNETRALACLPAGDGGTVSAHNWPSRIR